MRAIPVLTSVAVLVLARPWLAPLGAGQEAERPVGVYDEPRHHTVFESPLVRVLDIQVPAGDTTKFHTHESAILYVPIARSQTKSQVLGADWTGGSAVAAPRVPPPDGPRPAYANITYAEKPYTHRLNNYGTTLFRLIGIANHSKGAASADDNLAGAALPPEVENAYYRAHRVVLPPGHATPPHRHATPVIVVMQTSGTVVLDGATWSPLNGPGDIARDFSRQSHVVRNQGSTAVELVEVEVRGAS